MSKTNNNSPDPRIEVVEMIKLTYRTGNGTTESPVRFVTEYWDKNVFMWRDDPSDTEPKPS